MLRLYLYPSMKLHTYGEKTHSLTDSFDGVGSDLKIQLRRTSEVLTVRTSKTWESYISSAHPKLATANKVYIYCDALEYITICKQQTPEMLPIRTHVTYHIGEAYSFPCHVTGPPFLLAQWTKNGEPLLTNGEVTISTKTDESSPMQTLVSTLHLHHFHPLHSANYTCTAHSSFFPQDTAEQTFKLHYTSPAVLTPPQSFKFQKIPGKAQLYFKLFSSSYIIIITC